MKIVTINNNPHTTGAFDWENATYPALGITDTNRIILFTSRGIGTILQESDDPVKNHPMGHSESGWVMWNFKPHYEPVTIQMEKE